MSHGRFRLMRVVTLFFKGYGLWTRDGGGELWFRLKRCAGLVVGGKESCVDGSLHFGMSSVAMARAAVKCRNSFGDGPCIQGRVWLFL